MLHKYFYDITYILFAKLYMSEEWTLDIKLMTCILSHTEWQHRLNCSMGFVDMLL